SEPPGLSRRLDGGGKPRRSPRIEEGRNPCYIEGTRSRAKGDSRSVEAASKAVLSDLSRMRRASCAVRSRGSKQETPGGEVTLAGRSSARWALRFASTGRSDECC